MDRLMMKHMSVIYDSKNDKLVYNRKLQDGPGENMYGLEVCKSLNLPAAFLKRAHGLRMKYDPKKSNILAQKTSRYNSKKLRGNCKLCGKKGDEIHHLKHQINADVNGFFKSHHKNHPANLINLCESCHDKIHEDGKQHKIVKTSNGYEIEPI
jgi:DNA mismatch repair protein MutS